jgi:hypothetical protein
MRRFIAPALVSCLLVAPSLARAGDNDDIVFLTNGGRLRGTVMPTHTSLGALSFAF